VRILEKYSCEIQFFYCSLTSNKVKRQQEIIIQKSMSETLMFFLLAIRMHYRQIYIK